MGERSSMVVPGPASRNEQHSGPEDTGNCRFTVEYPLGGTAAVGGMIGLF
jgi:hypothetical protein